MECQCGELQDMKGRKEDFGAEGQSMKGQVACLMAQLADMGSIP